MSDILWTDVRRDWREFSIHDEHTIAGFFGEYRWLSNFEPCKLQYWFPTVENAYQAAKVKHEHVSHFRTMTPLEAKKRWRDYPLIDSSAKEWDKRKDEVMFYYLQQKFNPDWNPSLVEELKDTGSRELVELNYWRDNYWGVDLEIGGQNKLGKMLMQIRDAL